VPETVKCWKNYRLMQEAEGSGPLRYNADEVGKLFNLKPTETLTFRIFFAMVVYT
jgi:hypothetical protein